MASETKSDNPVADEVDEKSRRHVYRVGGVKVALRNAEIKRGPRGRFVRRLKEIIGRIHEVSEEPFSGVEAYEPPHRTVASNSVCRPVLGKEDLGKREGNKTSSDNDDCDDEN
jgi:hypothetical protein